jgi:hypothetical protein
MYNDENHSTVMMDLEGNLELSSQALEATNITVDFSDLVN